MSDKSAIEWTDATWNPTTGCTKVSPGCAHCYIERTPAFRIAGRKFVRGATDLRLHAERLEQPLHWRKPRRVFVNSLSDLFHDDVPDTFIDQVFAVMALCPQHVFQILTKRPERMRAYFGHHEDEPKDLRDRIDDAAADFGACHANLDDRRWPLPNVWLGVSVENQHFADERIPLLLETPAAVRFISAEPLLGPVDLSQWLDDWPMWPTGDAGPRLGWVIAGGESGPSSRPCDLAWVRSIAQRCQAAWVACFVKQLGDVPVMNEAEWRDGNMRLLNARNDKRAPAGTVPLKFHASKAGDPEEWPADLRVREFPGGDAGIAPSAAPEAQG